MIKLLLVIFFLSLLSLKASPLKDLVLEKRVDKCLSIKDDNLYESAKDRLSANKEFHYNLQYQSLRSIIDYMIISFKRLNLSEIDYEQYTQRLTSSCGPSFFSSKDLNIIMKSRYKDLNNDNEVSSYEDIKSLSKLFIKVCSSTENNFFNFISDPLVFDGLLNNILKSKVSVRCTNSQCELVNEPLNSSNALNRGSFESEYRTLWCFDHKGYRFDKKQLLYFYAALLKGASPLISRDSSKFNTLLSKALSSEQKWSKEIVYELARSIDFSSELELIVKPQKKLLNFKDFKLDIDIAADPLDKLSYASDKIGWKSQIFMQKEFLYEIISKIRNKNNNVLELLAANLEANNFYNLEKKITPLKKITNFRQKFVMALYENLKNFNGSKVDLLGSGEYKINVRFGFGWKSLKKISRITKLDK